jgi:hypothetical protein
MNSLVGMVFSIYTRKVSNHTCSQRGICYCHHNLTRLFFSYLEGSLHVKKTLTCKEYKSITVEAYG